MTGHSSRPVGSRLWTLKVQAAVSCDTSTNSTNSHGITALTTLHLTTLIASTGMFCYTNQYHSTAVTTPTTRLKNQNHCILLSVRTFRRLAPLWQPPAQIVPQLRPVGRRSLTTETQVRSQDSPCEICGGQSGTVTGFPPSTSAFHIQYNNSFTHLSLTLNTVQEHEGDSFVITTVVSSVRQEHHFSVAWTTYIK